MTAIARLAVSRWAGLTASTLLCALYAQGLWPLAFVSLVPWLLTLDREASWRGTLLSGWLMSVGYTLAGFAWFASAVARYTGASEAMGFAVLLVAAPLFQPQILLSALARHAVGARPVRAALVWLLAWVAAEWALPRLLMDTWAYGLPPALPLSQAAALVGASGVTALLLGVQALLALAWQWRPSGWRTWGRAVALAAGLPLLMWGYGMFGPPSAAAAAAAAVTGPMLKLGLLQSNLTDYDRLRRELGAGATVRRILDTHFAMSYDAVVNQHVDAVVWSETVYPTSFGNAKSEAGAELDREIQAIVNSAGVPFVFGTYERSNEGEYNAAAFVEPQRGLLGFYRKTRLFPFTEFLPPALDALRPALPWAGAWLPGSGARVLPLRLRDGREVPVQPLICRDDLDAQLAIDGARLGAQALVTLSNDAWFPPQGAALHLAAAAYRSIETGLPQFRVTPSGHSAVIDANGRVVAGSRWGEQTLVVGSLPVGNARPTLMLRWGDWVGRLAAGLLALLPLLALARRLHPHDPHDPQAAPEAGLPDQAALISPATRAATALLRGLSRLSLLAMALLTLLALWGDESFSLNSLTPLAQLRLFAALCLLPEAAAWLLLRACRAELEVSGTGLTLRQGSRELHLPRAELAAVQPWRLPLPSPGAALRLQNGKTWPHAIAGCNAWALAQVLQLPLAAPPPTPAAAYLRSLGTPRTRGWRHWLTRPAVKFLALPLLLALPAFHLHQQIAYGSAWGEWLSFGPQAYATAFALWWAGWIVGISLCAAALRAVIEAGMLTAAWLKPAQLAVLRPELEAAGLVLLYAGVPGWLVWRLVG